ncbi:MAG TPA: hypothetical protein VFN30_11740 [Chitinophagaceae bacterium]|nr:hypothetical protein [Chitinophagaceae bacterium]
MKLPKNNSEFQGLPELSFNEAVEINGGESLWYWISYGISAGAHGVVNGLQTVHEALKQPDYLIGIK